MLSYPAEKGKVSALKAMKAVPGDQRHILGDDGATDLDITEAVRSFFLALYKQRGLASLNTARYEINRTQKNPPALKTLPSIESMDSVPIYRCCFRKQQTALSHQWCKLSCLF